MATLRLIVTTPVIFGLLAGTAVAGSGGRPLLAQVTPLLAVDGATAGAELELGLSVRLPDGVHVNSNRPRDPSLIPVTLTVDAPPGVVPLAVGFPRPTDLRQRGQDELLSVFEHTFLVGVRLKLADTLPAGPVDVPVRLRYQACDETRCYRPMVVTSRWSVRVVSTEDKVRPVRPGLFRDLLFERLEPARPVTSLAPPSVVQTPAAVATPPDPLDGFSVVKSTGGYLTTREFLRFLQDSHTGSASPFEGRSGLTIVLLVLAGGLALNLTPCVLPLIPINLAILGAGTAAASRTRGLLLGCVYGGAMAIAYGGLGAIVVLTSSAFGAINASPWFNAGIAVLFVALGLALFDRYFNIDFSRFSTSLSPAGTRGSITLAASTGALSALLAGACVAPVVIQVIVFSTHLYAAGTHSALALPFVLGLGMAAPWPLAGAGLASVPRPGAWMVRVKQTFGVMTLLLAGYYAYTAYGLAADRISDRRLTDTSTSPSLDDGWHTSLDGALHAAARGGSPVIVDLWATWCKNCLVMDKTTLADPAVRAALAPYVKVKFQAEDPDAAPVRDVMERLGAVGLPTYVVLQPRAK